MQERQEPPRLRRYVQVNDPHVSDQPPRMRTATYLDDVLAKLGEAAALADRLEAALVITGDLFHRKNAAHTTHRTVQRVRQALGHAPVVYIVPGNHDEAHGGGLEGQPLLSVVDPGWGHIRFLGASPDGRETLDGGAADPYIGAVPWDNAFERPGGAELLAARIAALNRPLVFTHAPISDRPFPFGPEAAGWVLDSDVVAALPPDSAVRLIAHGHMHDQQPLTWWPRGEYRLAMSNPGALARASIAERDLQRAPSVAVIDYDPADDLLAVTYTAIPHRPAADVFRLDEHGRAQDRDAHVVALAAALRAVEAEVVDEEALRAMLAGITRPDDIDADVWAAGVAMVAAGLDEQEV